MFSRGHFPAKFSGFAARLADSQGGRSFSPATPPRTDIGLPATKQRIENSFYLVTFIIALLGLRLVWLQGLGQAPLRIEAAKTQVVAPRRADILARDGTALAVTLDEYTVSANPRGVQSAWRKQKLARLLAKTIGGDEKKYFTLLLKETNAKGGPNYYVRAAH